VTRTEVREGLGRRPDSDHAATHFGVPHRDGGAADRRGGSPAARGLQSRAAPGVDYTNSPNLADQQRTRGDIARHKLFHLLRQSRRRPGRGRAKPHSATDGPTQGLTNHVAGTVFPAGSVAPQKGVRQGHIRRATLDRLSQPPGCPAPKGASPLACEVARYKTLFSGLKYTPVRPAQRHFCLRFTPGSQLKNNDFRLDCTRTKASTSARNA
jgi:hypothetical protein